MVAQFHALIRKLERITRRQIRARHACALFMEGVNRQEEYFEEVREMICAAPQTPVRMHEQVSNVMAAQWLRGSDWAIAHARAFRDEVRQRVERASPPVPNERLRLMWVGAGLWHDTDFYTAFEEQHGAVFVWSMYLAFGPDGYIRYGLDDPLRALASRTVSFNEQLHNPPWANEWIVDQAKRHRIDGAVILMPEGSSPPPRARTLSNAPWSKPGFQRLRFARTWWTVANGMARRCESASVNSWTPASCARLRHSERSDTTVWHFPPQAGRVTQSKNLSVSFSNKQLAPALRPQNKKARSDLHRSGLAFVCY